MKINYIPIREYAHTITKSSYSRCLFYQMEGNTCKSMASCSNMILNPFSHLFDSSIVFVRAGTLYRCVVERVGELSGLPQILSYRSSIAPKGFVRHPAQRNIDYAFLRNVFLHITTDYIFISAGCTVNPSPGSSS